MEVNPNKGPQRAAERDRLNRQPVPGNETPTKPRQRDRIELSESARLIAGQESVDSETRAERLERLAELRDLVAEGRLNTPERAQQAATRLLEGE